MHRDLNAPRPDLTPWPPKNVPVAVAGLRWRTAPDHLKEYDDYGATHVAFVLQPQLLDNSTNESKFIVVVSGWLPLFQVVQHRMHTFKLASSSLPLRCTTNNTALVSHQGPARCPRPDMGSIRGVGLHRRHGQQALRGEDLCPQLGQLLGFKGGGETAFGHRHFFGDGAKGAQAPCQRQHQVLSCTWTS